MPGRHLIGHGPLFKAVWLHRRLHQQASILQSGGLRGELHNRHSRYLRVRVPIRKELFWTGHLSLSFSRTWKSKLNYFLSFFHLKHSTFFLLNNTGLNLVTSWWTKLAKQVGWAGQTNSLIICMSTAQSYIYMPYNLDTVVRSEATVRFESSHCPFLGHSFTKSCVAKEAGKCKWNEHIVWIRLLERNIKLTYIFLPSAVHQFRERAAPLLLQSIHFLLGERGVHRGGNPGR